MGRLRVISAEGLVAFKLQGYETLDREALEGYFRLFEREDLLEALIDEARG